MPDPETLEGIAIVGMSGRFPGARDLEEYWRNLRYGVEAISRFTGEELEAAGIPREIVEAPDYVRAGGVIEGVEMFDAQLFGFTARDAELLDPHHRLFLETAWQALEHAGYDSSRYPGAVGVFGGMGMGEYLLKNLHSNPDVLRAAGGLRLRIYNDKDFLASLTAYKLDLKGPSVSVQTACSTSLVAASLACQSLVSYQCDMALAGGVCLSVPPKAGYFAHEGVFSPDGHCRAFDAGAQGTVAGAGAGVLVLKRLADAVADGDTVHAVIKGWAMNNDGSLKVGYTAPSLDGQAEVIAMAQAVAGVDPGSVTYIEAHGTGTPMGDQVEIAALTQVFRESTDRTGFCAVGSVKTAIGHLDAAAGAASLIKTTLALEHRELPPSLNFERPNPAIDFANSPFYVNAALRPWETGGGPRRAGVSAFAVGGVNAHLILEEAPAPAPASPGRPWQLLVLSARTETALEAATDRLAAYLERQDRAELADVAFTLERGRRVLRHRRALVCRDADEAAAILRHRGPKRLFTAAREAGGRQAAFLFPGLGNHYVSMARGLYRDEEVFRREIDRCAEILQPHLGLDLRTALYPAGAEEASAAGGAPDLRRMLGRGGTDEGAGELIQTRLAQPVLFAVEYALATLWREWGIEPRAMAGYSIGEYVAACLAGVFTLQDALRLVAERARLIDSLPAGAMLAVPLSEEAVRPLLGGDISLAAVNGPEVCVVAGPVPAVQELERRLGASGVACRRLETTHAFHSTMMEPIAGRFAEMVRAVPRRAPEIPWLSNVTGTWITPEQATDPRYWADHLVKPVRFADILRELWREPSRVLLEVGPGQALSAWALQLPAEGEEAGERVALPTLRHVYDPQPDGAFLLATLGRLWLAGMDVPGEGFRAGERRRRVPLPTYPFERNRYWIDPGRTRPLSSPEESLERAAVADWFWTPAWKESPALAAAPREAAAGPWLVFADREGLGFRLAGLLEERGAEVVLVVAGERFERVEEGAYVLAPADREGYARLLTDLAAEGWSPARVLHLWGVSREAPSAGESLDLGLHSLVFFGQALAESRREEPLELTVIASHLHAVTGDEEVHPEKATLLGACAVLPLEIPGVSCRVIDLLPPASGSRRERELTERLLAELATEPAEQIVAYRGGRRWTRDFQASRLAEASARGLRGGGVYLITGGRGGIGLVLARELARSVRAKLVLVGRSPAQPHVLRELEALGAEVLAVTADVTDRDAMRRVRAQAEERFGAIHGVLHAAGVPPGGMLQLKTREQLAEVLAPKVAGTRVLEEVFADADLDFLMLFSSLTSLLGAFGLVDHAAANAFLDAFAHDAVRRGIPAVSVHWDTWLEVGQAAAAAAGYGLDEGEGRTVHSTVLRTDTHWVVDEHRIAGQGLLPGTGYLEMVRVAFAEWEGDAPAELSRIAFTGPLIVPDGATVEVRTVLDPAGEGYEFRVESRAGSGTWREHARGRVRAASSASAGKADLARLAAEARGREAGSVGGGQEQGIGFGPRWNGLVRSLTASESQALALLELPAEFHSDLREHPLHPALLDAATGFVQLLGEGTYLPLGYEKVTVRRPLPARFYSHARYSGGAAGETLACDLTLLGEDGEELIAIEGYTLRRIGDPRAVAAASVPAARERESLEGIRPEEGAEAFRRLLSAGPLPAEILVSIRPFPSLLRRSRAISRERLMEEAERLHVPGAVHARPNLPTSYEAPRTEAEERLAGLWQNLLGLDAVGIHDDFFDLGGDSLLATRLIGLLEEAFGVQLSLRAVFEAPTVAEMAALVATDEAPAVAMIPSRGPGASRFPLSPGQQRFWLLDQLQPGTGAYNIPVAARLRGDLDPGALARSFAALGERHEALRTSFAAEDGRPVQVIAPAFRAALPLIDLGGLPQDIRDEKVRLLAVAEGQRGFDLARGPLVRLGLLRLSASEHVALLTFHHAVADRWSVGIFFRELMALYEAFRAGRPSPLPPLPFQYANFAVWHRERLEEGGVLDQQIAYWRERLAGAPAALDLPTDYPRPKVARQFIRQGHLPLAVDRGLAEALRGMGRESEASLSMILLAAFNALLARFTGEEDVVVGSPIANRGHFGVQDLIGHFANDLVLRTDLAGDPSFRELLGRVREGVLGAYDNADVPIEKLIEVLRPEREPGRNPLAQVFFVLENVPMPSGGPQGLGVDLLEVERPAGQFDLLVYLSETPDGVSGSLFYDADIFATETMSRFADSFGAILERVARDPGTHLSALPLTGDLEARAEKLLLAVTATFTADLLADPLVAWMEELGIRSRIEFAPYNQVFQQLLDPSSLLGRNARGVNAVLVRFEDWVRDFERNVQDFVAALRASAARSAAFHLVIACPPSPGREELHAGLEDRLAAALDGSGVHFVRAGEVLDLYPVAAPWDPHADEIGHVPYTMEFFAVLGTVIARKVQARRAAPVKVIAVDCDNTLWCGVCGEDGPLGVTVDPPRRALQEFLVAQHDAGALICLLSKNSEADVDEVFARRPEMPLRPEHVVARRINWELKSANLRSLAAELGLGLDSFAVLDDNPVECAEIQAGCPEALVLRLPERAEEIPGFLRHVWAFDRLEVTAEDRQRTALYRQNLERERFRGQAVSFADFLAGLGLEVEVAEIAGRHIERAAQLTVRTNQFNASSVRRTEAEVRDFLATGGEGRIVEVRDRFGDYGLVGLILFRAAGQVLEVDTFLLSCRVLGKGVEHRMLAELGRLAGERGLRQVVVPFRRTPRNQPVLDFLSSVGTAEGSVFPWSAAAAAAVSLTAPALITPEEPGTAAPVRAAARRAGAELSDAGELLAWVKSKRRPAAEEPEAAFVAPRTPIEELLAEIWMDLLGTDRVGVHDSFFRLGGHSLLGTILLSRVRDTFEVEVPLFTLFEAPTLGALAERIEVALIQGELEGLQEEEMQAFLASEDGAVTLKGRD